MADGTIRVGILGAGYIADWHMKALKTIRGRTVTAVCDLVPGRAQAFADRWGIPESYTSLADMLARARLDHVHVLSPPDLHFAPALEIVRAGVKAVLEKPACVTASECRQLAEAVAHNPSQVSVSHNFLFSPCYESLRTDLRSGVFGPVSEIDIVWNKELGQFRGGPFGAWLFKHPGNVILEVGPHSLGHLFDLMPEAAIHSVVADSPHVVPGGLEVPRRWVVDARSGATAIRLGWSLGAGFTEHRIHLRGLFGSATVDFDAGTYVKRLHTPLPDDFDRYRITRNEGAQLRSQSRGRISRYVLSKFKLSKRGNDFGSSIATSIAACGIVPQDSRVSLALATKTIAACETIVRMGVPEVKTQAILSPALPPTDRPPILVLGGTGFIGQALVRRLCEAGERVRLMVRDPRGLANALRALPLEVVRGSTSSEADMLSALKDVKIVYHLARANVKTWKDYQDQEIGGTRIVAEACLQSGIDRLIYTGTIDSYYAGDPGETIRDDSPLDPDIAGRNLYARAKAESEAMLMQMHRERNLPLVILRPGIVIGSGGSPFHWGIGMWNGMGVCRMWGKGQHTMPLVLVDDCAEALVAARSADGIVGNSYNLVGPGLLTAEEYLDAVESQGHLKLNRRRRAVARYWLFDMAKWVVKILVRHPERRRPTYRDWNSRTQSARFDCSKAKAALKWEPTGDRAKLIEEGIGKPVREWLM